MTQSLITVKCPTCGGILEIDTLTGAVVNAAPKSKLTPGEDFMAKRLAELDQDKARRDALVERQRERERNKKGEIDKLFEKVREEAASGVPVERQIRDIDLD
jgi:hypothetical protein